MKQFEAILSDLNFQKGDKTTTKHDKWLEAWASLLKLKKKISDDSDSDSDSSETDYWKFQI